jgi:hypothetical protein
MGTNSMRRWLLGGVMLTTALGAVAARACMDYRERPVGVLAEAVSQDPAVAKAAVAELRARGPRGLEELLRAYRPLLERATTANYAGYPGSADVPPPAAAVHKRLAAAVDLVAAQKDASYSRLYWYTDFEQAKKAAREQGDKPILSLRLLGKLDEEFSCANSRYFRTVLYANAEVSAALRERFVLHWQSVRPVPKVTIDMGDGRVVERTVTGNSVHYVLDGEGRPVDAIPGLYGPKAFLRVLEEAERAARGAAAQKTDDDRRSYLAAWHDARQRETSERLARELKEAGLEAAPEGDSPAWAKLASLPQHRIDARLDQASVALFNAKNPDARAAGRRAMAKAVVEDPLARMLANFQRSVALDSVRNEYELHQRVRQWFVDRVPQTLAADVAPLNEKVYAELFLTPSSDPWLGLAPADAYTGLEGNGVKLAAKASR